LCRAGQISSCFNELLALELGHQELPPGTLICDAFPATTATIPDEITRRTLMTLLRQIKTKYQMNANRHDELSEIASTADQMFRPWPSPDSPVTFTACPFAAS
jgi:hypothetical protein